MYIRKVLLQLYHLCSELAMFGQKMAILGPLPKYGQIVNSLHKLYMIYCDCISELLL